MDKKLLILFALIILSSSVYALSKADIVYPVSELGNCASETDCQAYCDNNVNIEACLTFGEKYGLMSQAEIDEAKKVMKFILDGTTPGGCKTKQECDDYCNNDQNINECIDFALKAGFISSEEAEMAKKTGGKGPGGCKREECKTYCDDESHIIECIDFAYQNGMMSKEEYDMAKKTGGKGPGNCKGKEECDAYCKEHELECMKFGVDHGLAPEMDEESKCMMDCMVKNNIVCKPGPNGGSDECKKCGEECSQYYKGPCLFGDKYEEKVKICDEQHMASKPVMGDSEQEGRGECAVDIECVPNPEGEDMGPSDDSSQQYDPSKGGPAPTEGEKSCGDCASKCEPKEGQVLKGTDCVDNQCKCYYETEQQEQQNQNPQEGQIDQAPQGGTTEQPGDAGGSGDSGSEETGGDSGSNDGSGSSGSGGDSGGGESSGDSGASGITGGVVSDSKNQNSILVKIYNFFRKVFN